ncbi:MAG TPA: hypothetical protein VJL83_00595 [Patescibacteria group bacterium]|nr:hypothetical protein [Patescibacteria group bacterium]
MLEDLIISRVRVKILALFFLNPDKMYHLREIQRQTNEAMNAIRREMEYLQSKGFASSERRGNRKYFQMRRDNPLYFDLLGLINKTEGLGRAIIENRAKLGKIKFIMFSGRFIRNLPRRQNEVDMMLVGTVVLPEIMQYIRLEEKRRNIEINYTVMSEEEFAFRKKRRDPFVTAVLAGSRLLVIGDEEELVR